MHETRLLESAETPGYDDGGVDVRSPSAWRRLTPLLPVAVGALVAILVSLAWLQTLHPYLEHDDWDSLLPVTPARTDIIHGRLLSEGRWLNYWWWLGPGHLFSTVGAALLYLVGYATFVAGVARRWAPGWLGLVVVVALFAAPMPAAASFWPATLALSMVVAGLAAWTLPPAIGLNRTLAPWIVVVVMLSFLTYPPVTLVLFVVLVVELIDDSWKRLIGATALFGLSYLMATVTAFALNKDAFGKFGIEVRPWRQPNPLHNLHDLRVNVARYLLQLDQLVRATALPVVLGAVAVAVCLLVPDLRRRALRLMLGAIVVASVEAGPTILYGVRTPYRASWWAWLFPLIPLVWLARKQTALPWPRSRSVYLLTLVRAAALLALVAVGVSGIQDWRDGIHFNQDRFAKYSSIMRQLGAARQQHPSDRVLIYGDAFDWKHGSFVMQAQYLRARATYTFGISVSDCRPPACLGPERAAVASQVQRHLQVIQTAGVIYIVPQSVVHLQPRFR